MSEPRFVPHAHRIWLDAEPTTVYWIRDTRLGWTAFHTLNDQGIGSIEEFSTWEEAQMHADELNAEWGTA